MRNTAQLLVAALALLLCAQAAAACKCRYASIQQHFAQSNDVVRHKVLQHVEPPSSNWTVQVVSEVVQVYTGCLQAGQRVLVTTPSSSAACGVEFEDGVEYVSAVNQGQWDDERQLLEVHARRCMLNQVYALQNPYERFFLATRRVRCNGALLGCANDLPPVHCLVNPCDVQRCPVAGSQCTANYCGSCLAEFSDNSGSPICYFCDSDNDCGYSQRCFERQCVPLDFGGADAATPFASVL